MSRLDLLVGDSWGQRVVVLGTLGLYAALFVTDPGVARAGLAGGLSTVTSLATTIVAAFFLASAIGELLPEDRLAEFLGASASVHEVVAAGLVAGLIPGGPYAVYPIVDRMRERGADTPAVLTMLTGYNLISVGRVPYGLVFFGPHVIGLRLLVAGTATVAVGTGLFALGALRRGA
ncbi:uncharacterized membrane protein YraQ (UPF0718 family) [Halarchaeum rubridurum]|uniref:Uncharacterized membrane protein YraQ (UPF0718 family) n=1 Tax=Halarchaeum rubridurum TaxID=489911 RepID=A0A830FUN8_9EURY|nr:permease [Halarchaeum rubridurum]MBP1954553.1 uncharacterized membrane protein YraQ (UPF0718 family) [Halarchaeum rubridurum]GGM61993.1 hypothetical protein GCM10009017_10090 [Halarchaeum rubridurum]